MSRSRSLSGGSCCEVRGAGGLLWGPGQEISDLWTAEAVEHHVGATDELDSWPRPSVPQSSVRAKPPRRKPAGLANLGCGRLGYTYSSAGIAPSSARSAKSLSRSAFASGANPVCAIAVGTIADSTTTVTSLRKRPLTELLRASDPSRFARCPVATHSNRSRHRAQASVLVPQSGFITPARIFVITPVITTTKSKWSRSKRRAFAGLSCAREDSNLHPVKAGQGPQPCASTNSATGAWVVDYRRGSRALPGRGIAPEAASASRIRTFP
jgi:hypothetical protein